MRTWQRSIVILFGVLAWLNVTPPALAEGTPVTFDVLVIGSDGVVDDATLWAESTNGGVKAESLGAGMYRVSGAFKNAVPLVVEHSSCGQRVFDFSRPGDSELVMVDLAATKGSAPAGSPDAGGNDLCSGATPVAIPSVTSGTTVGATFDDAGLCDFSNTGPGVWYSVIGDGTRLTASLCNSGGSANYDAKLSVYSGGCGTLTCVGGDDDFCSFAGPSQVSWCGEDGVEYLVLVHGFGAAVGDFDLSVSSSGLPCGPPPNDLCADAIAVGVPSVTSGSTLDATFDAAPTCDFTNTGPGVWYTVTGTGNTMTASLCSGTDYDSKISVFCSCDDLACVGGDDDFCSFAGPSEISWCSQAGVSYAILVHGFLDAAGNFDLAITDNGVACTGAVQCIPTGACCNGSDCTTLTADDCQAAGGDYLGDGTSCEGDRVVRTSMPNIAIPDGDPVGISDTINMGMNLTISDLDVDLQIDHTFVGDFCITLEHNGVSVNLVARPGADTGAVCHLEGPFGCGFDDYDIVLDDEGAGGSVEDLCAVGMTSPPNYTPFESLSAFDGMDAAGDWTISVSDNAGLDTGVFLGWSLHFADADAEGPCTVDCNVIPSEPCDFDVQPDFPMLVYDSQGMLNYDASSDILGVDSTPLVIRFAPGEPPRLVTGDRSMTVRLEVNELGELVGGVDGPDLEIIGAVDVDGDGTIDFSGVLLTGEVVNWCFDDNPPAPPQLADPGRFFRPDGRATVTGMIGDLSGMETSSVGGDELSIDEYDLCLEVSGGLLADLYGSNEIGITVTSEDSDFDGCFEIDFGGGAKGNVGPTDCDPDDGGACCLQNGSCLIATAADCMENGLGSYQGDGTDCASTDCPQPGACCLPDGACVMVTHVGGADCFYDYQGPDTTCDTTDCPVPTGACCLDSGGCLITTEMACDEAGKEYQGDFTTCEDPGCPMPGACCETDGTCTVGVVIGGADCMGDYQGDDTDCMDVNCAREGACCLSDGNCVISTEADCMGDYQGNDTDCMTAGCPMPGACCLPSGACVQSMVVGGSDCNGEYQGDGTSCDTTDCPEPEGACCLDNGGCITSTEAECDEAGKVYQGDMTDCATDPCPQPGACCLSDGTCVMSLIVGGADCDGDYQGDNTNCDTTMCPQPGACCLEDGTCVQSGVLGGSDCAGEYQGDGTSCNSVSCDGACCLLDTSPGGLSITQGSSQDAVAGNSITFDEPGVPVGVNENPYTFYSASDGVTFGFGDGQPYIADDWDALAGAFGGNGTGNSLLSQFGIRMVFDSDITALDFQFVADGNCCFPFGGVFVLLLDDDVEVGSYGGDASYGTTVGSWFHVQAAGGAKFDEVRVFNGAFSSFTQIVDNITFSDAPGLNCTITDGEGCAAAGGVYQGLGTTCEDVVCAAPGACCLPPTGPFTCSGDVTEISMRWNGMETIRVKAWKGNVGSELLADISDVMPGDLVTVGGYGGSPNDVIWQICDAAGNEIGQSKFHLSCSDDEMDGPEDCGTPQGNGKSNEAGLVNDWQLAGIVTTDEVLNCAAEGFGGALCVELEEDECIAVGGDFQGFGTTCDEVDCFGADCCAEGDLVALTFRYTADDCSASSGDAVEECIDSGALTDRVRIIVSDDDTPGEGRIYFDGSVNFGDEFTATSAAGGQSKFPSRVYIHVLSEDGMTSLQRVRAHTSCSRDLFTGDRFGSALLVGCANDALLGLEGDASGVDLIDVLQSWGMCPECPSDVDKSGAVDQDDLLRVLGAF